MRWLINKSIVNTCLCLAVCGCVESNSVDDPNEIDPASVQTREERIELRRQLQQSKKPERFTEEDPPAVTGEVPVELLEKVSDDLQKRTGGDQSVFKLLRAQSMLWNDGALGCAEPGQVYQQVPVDGYWIVFEHQGKFYDYRASDRGYFKLCPGFSLERATAPKL